MKKRLFATIVYFVIFTLLLSSLAALCVCSTQLSGYGFYIVLAVTLVFDILILILACLFASKISDEFVKPVMRMNFEDKEPFYEELRPLFNRIKTQSREDKLSMQIRREFSANVSHELKTPLTTILGYSQIISNEMAKPDDIKDIASKIEKESTRLLTLINDIIKLSHLEEDGAAPEMEPVDLFEAAKDVVSRLLPQAKDRNVTIEINGVQSMIRGNRTQISELISNLTENAVKYNRDGGSVKITVCNGSLVVSDTGIGIEPEYRDRIFERFFRVDKSRSKKVNGTGLGLSIVKHIAIMHGARINVDSTPGKGTEITVDFTEL